MQGTLSAHGAKDGLDGMGLDVEVAVDAARPAEQAELVAKLGEQPVKQGGIDAVGLAQRVENAVGDVLVEIQARACRRQGRGR